MFVGVVFLGVGYVGWQCFGYYWMCVGFRLVVDVWVVWYVGKFYCKVGIVLGVVVYCCDEYVISKFSGYFFFVGDFQYLFWVECWVVGGGLYLGLVVQIMFMMKMGVKCFGFWCWMVVMDIFGGQVVIFLVVSFIKGGGFFVGDIYLCVYVCCCFVVVVVVGIDLLFYDVVVVCYFLYCVYFG